MSKIGEMSTFQIVLMTSFGVAAVMAVAVFAIGSFGGGPGPTKLNLWGSMEESLVREWVEKTFEENEEVTVEYRYILPEKFDRELLEAMAMGKGPDMILINQNQIAEHERRIYEITSSSFSERRFRDTFIQAGEVFLNRDKGYSYGFPVLIDPVVMYWNRSLVMDSAYARPPESWDEFPDFVSGTVKRRGMEIEIASVALGEYENIEHSKEILNTLIFQQGGGIIKKSASGFNVVLDDKINEFDRPALKSLLFYTEFSDPESLVYSWNRDFDNSFERFINGDLVVYFGKASDVVRIREKNPLFNFDVAVVPENEEGRSVSSSNVWGLSIMKTTKNISASFSALSALSSSGSLMILSDSLNGIPPARIDMLSNPPEEPFYRPVFYRAARSSQSWVDPIPKDVDVILKEMVESAVGNREEKEVSGFIKNAHIKIFNLLKGR